jgi:hypothetical protein
MEQLEKLFPEGFVLVYRSGEGHRVHKHNPLRDEILEDIFELMGSVDADDAEEEIPFG